MSNGKDLDYFSPEKENASSEMMGNLKNVKDRLPEDIKDPHKVETKQIPPRVDISKKEISKSGKKLFLRSIFERHFKMYQLRHLYAKELIICRIYMTFPFFIFAECKKFLANLYYTILLYKV